MLFVNSTVKVLAQVAKTTEGRLSSWKFCSDEGKFFALRLSPSVKVTPCRDLDDLRRLYKRLTTESKYGFSPVVVPQEAAVV